MILRFSSGFYAFSAFLKALWAKIARYELLVDEETRQKRVLTCESCEFLTEERQCAICTCYIDFKAALGPESCPRGKWPSKWVKIVSSKAGKTAHY